MKLVLRYLIFIILVFINIQKIVSQEWNSARLTVLYGSNIPFNFNTLDKIKNGIEINLGTKFGITLADSSKVGHTLQGFVLNFRSFNSQANIKGDVYSLPLNRIRVRAENSLGLGSGFSYGYQDLTSDWVPLFTYTNTSWVNLDWANYQLNVSFECGKPTSGGGNGSLMGEEPDYYNVEIEFELVPTGPGF
jgi:hypothetical protein